MTKKALVVVLGDLARSPRMQYHCTSLADNNYQVAVIATGGASGQSTRDRACEELESNPNIKQNLFQDVPNLKKYLPSVIAYLIKPIWQSFLLIYYLTLITIHQAFIPNVIILQNPPTIPTLPITFIYSKLTGSKLVIDWHNYGYSILSLNLKPTNLIVKISKSIEIFFGRHADAGLCVSEAMRKDLVKNFNINYPIHVLYDRPPKHFKPLSLREKHNFYLKMKQQIPEFKSPHEDFFKQQSEISASKRKVERSETRFTITNHLINKDVVMMRPKRPAIIMSSTSWTEDEDFNLLLEALRHYDETRTNQLLKEDSTLEEDINFTCLPHLVCVITGKGPLKVYYEEKINEYKFKHIDIVLPWLDSQDYPKMVASCDLGISLHSSSSGVDLPMKVVDMFGCGIPVLAYEYQAISELVIDDFYGQTFKNSEELFTKLALLLKDFFIDSECSLEDVECCPLERYKKNIKRRFLLSRWEDNWNRTAKPVLDKLCNTRRRN